MIADGDPIDPKLEALLREHSTDAPSSDIDAAILAAAHRAVQSAPQSAVNRAAEATRPWRWWMPLAAAATIGAIASACCRSRQKNRIRRRPLSPIHRPRSVRTRSKFNQRRPLHRSAKTMVKRRAWRVKHRARRAKHRARQAKRRVRRFGWIVRPPRPHQRRKWKPNARLRRSRFRRGSAMRWNKRTQPARWRDPKRRAPPHPRWRNKVSRQPTRKQRAPSNGSRAYVRCSPTVRRSTLSRN